MPKRTDISSILAIGAGLMLAQPAAAQELEPVAVDLIPGVVFAGAGGVDVEVAVDGTPVATFWRPLQYRHDDELLAGRMQCRAAAQRAPYRAALFALEGVHEAQVEQDRLDGFTELDTRMQQGDTINRLDVLGRRSSPRRYEVLTYVAVRTGSDLVSLRQNCQFLRDGVIYRQNFIDYVDQYTSFILALPPPDTPDPATALSLDSFTDLPE